MESFHSPHQSLKADAIIHLHRYHLELKIHATPGKLCGLRSSTCVTMSHTDSQHPFLAQPTQSDHYPPMSRPPAAGESDSSRNDLDTADDDLDVTLMLRVGQGDESAFERLIERHQHVVVGTVAKMLGNAADAEDIAQQVFIRLWKSAPRYKPRAKFTTFLFTITRRLVFNESRRRSRKREYSIEEREDDYHLQTPDEHRISPDEDMLQRELRLAVDQAIAQLPEKQRLALILRRYEEMPYDEIGKILGISISAVKSQLFRARHSLREALQKYMES